LRFFSGLAVRVSISRDASASRKHAATISDAPMRNGELVTRCRQPAS
jgi:hypothetical protein